MGKQKHSVQKPISGPILLCEPCKVFQKSVIQRFCCHYVNAHTVVTLRVTPISVTHITAFIKGQLSYLLRPLPGKSHYALTEITRGICDEISDCDVTRTSLLSRDPTQKFYLMRNNYISAQKS